MVPDSPGVTGSLGHSGTVQPQDDFVHYFVNGMPVYCQEKEDKNGYCFVLATLVNNKFCSIKELNKALGVQKKNVERYATSLSCSVNITLSGSPVVFHTVTVNQCRDFR